MTNHEARRVISRVLAGESFTLSKFPDFNQDSLADQTVLIGGAILFDVDLSVNRNQACDSCHIIQAGFTGGISDLNKFNTAYFGSQGSPKLNHTPTLGGRAGNRRSINYAYTVFAPPLSIVNGDLVGGLFWDMRATGLVTGDAAVDQAMGPFTNPVEHALPDPACAVLAVSRAKYASQFVTVWGPQSFNITTWPSNVDQICRQPNNGTGQTPVTSVLSPADQTQAAITFQNIAKSVVAFERSTIDSPFSSKFDNFLCGKATLSGAEQNGLNIFMDPLKGNCNSCHTATPQTCGGNPLFTNFKSVNIGVPKDPLIPFLTEDQPDTFGFTANPLGRDYADNGVGDMLRALDASNPTNPFASLNPSSFDGKFLVPTLRNITKTPKPVFVRAYAHNGEFKSVQEIIHYHATRDTLGGGVKCKFNDPNSKTSGIGTTCWPPPEQLANMDTTVGNLPLSSQDEQDLVTFLDTLNDLSIGPFP